MIVANDATFEQWIGDPNRFVFSEQLLQMRIGIFGAEIIGGEKPTFDQVVRIERAPPDAGNPAKYKVSCEVIFSIAMNITDWARNESPISLASGDSAGLIGLTVLRSQFFGKQTRRAIIGYPVIFDVLITEENDSPVRLEIGGVRDKYTAPL